MTKTKHPALINLKETLALADLASGRSEWRLHLSIARGACPVTESEALDALIGGAQ